MVESLETKVSGHLHETRQEDSVWTKVLAAAFAVGLSVAAAYAVHEFYCSDQYRQIEQEANYYFCGRYCPR